MRVAMNKIKIYLKQILCNFQMKFVEISRQMKVIFMVFQRLNPNIHYLTKRE